MRKPAFFVGFAVSVMVAIQGGHEPRLGAAEPSFRFQSNFWVSLHHSLRGEARRRELKGPVLIKIDGLKPEERAAWTSALDAYAPFGRRDVVFDEGLIGINNLLTRLGDDMSLDRTAQRLDSAAKRGLTLAAPIYRAHFWPSQQQMNEHWIAAVQPAMAAHAASMAAALARVYRTEWPAAPIIIDAASEAGPNGAYTTDGPPDTAGHTTLESASTELQGDMAFETIFHEASHPVAGKKLFDAVNAEAARQNIAAPRDLAHVMIFYTVGELTRRELGKGGNAEYKPYAYRYQLYTGGWQRLRDALERDWQPYLDGKTPYEDALAALVRDASG